MIVHAAGGVLAQSLRARALHRAAGVSSAPSTRWPRRASVRARYVLVSCDWVYSGRIPAGWSSRFSERDLPNPLRRLWALEARLRGGGDALETSWLITRPGGCVWRELSRPRAATGVRVMCGSTRASSWCRRARPRALLPAPGRVAALAYVCLGLCPARYASWSPRGAKGSTTWVARRRLGVMSGWHDCWQRVRLPRGAGPGGHSAGLSAALAGARGAALAVEYGALRREGAQPRSGLPRWPRSGGWR